MKWISIKEQEPPKNSTLFIKGIEREGKKISTYFAESFYDGKNFQFPYYGQDISGNFENVTHWINPLDGDSNVIPSQNK